MRNIATKRMRRTVALAAAIITAGALVSCSPGADDGGGANGSSESGSEDWLADLDPMTLRIADWTAGDAETGIYGQAWEGFAERVEEATDGKVTFEFYWGTSLLNATDAMGGVRDGVADISVVNSVYYPSELPVGTWLSGLGAAASGSFVHDIAAAGATAFETAQTFEPLVEEWTSQNLYPLMTVGSAPYNLICTEPIETLEDAEGVKARTAGDAWTHTFEALGMSMVNVSYNEIYEGLQRGVIDCVTINPNQLVSSLVLEDVAPYYHPVTFPLWQATNFVMTLDLWESLPVELQRIMHDEAAQVAFDIWDRFIELESMAGDAIASGDVVKTVEASELDETARAANEEYLQSLVDSAPASIEDPEQFIADYVAEVERRTQILIDQGYELPGRDIDSVLESFATLAETDYTEFNEIFVEEYVDPSRP